MKYEITIHTGKLKGFRQREYTFSTDQEIPVEYFTTRRSLSSYDFPRYVEGEVTETTETGGRLSSWKDFNNFQELNVQNIKDILVNGKSINEQIIKEAKKHGAEVKFPLLYQAQFIFADNPDWVFNWYITTGTLSKQKTTEKYYRMIRLGIFADLESALQACKS